METSCPFFSSREAASPGWRTSKKKAGRGRRGQPPALDSLSGNKDSAKAERLPPSRWATHGTSRSRMRPCSPTVPQAGAPVSARSFCTSPCGRHGNGHWAQLVCRTKGALGVPQAPRWPPALTVCRCRGKHRTYPRFPPGPAACVPAGHDSRLRTACHAPRQTGNSLNRNIVSLAC